MIGSKPKFFDSPYFVMEFGNWNLKPGAPADIVKEFNDYMNQDKLEEEKPVKKSFTDRINEMLSQTK
jgi:hypothetical protein